MDNDNKRGESTAQACGHFNLAPYGCEHCFKSHEEIAAERDASKRDDVTTGVQKPPDAVTRRIEMTFNGSVVGNQTRGTK